MDIISNIFRALYEIARLVRTFFTSGVYFIALCTRSRTALAAENLFLRKQLAFYQERKVVKKLTPHYIYQHLTTDIPI